MRNLHAVVVTGSRSWQDKAAVFAVLEEELRRATRGKDRFLIVDGFLVIHGDCPTGADYFANRWAFGTGGVTSVPMPAPWKGLGKQAGPSRNYEMSRAASALMFCGWNVRAHAFGLKQSLGGTKDCVRKLRGLQIEVSEHEEG